MNTDENSKGCRKIRINKLKNSYIPITFKTGDKISFIGDIGDNELIEYLINKNELKVTLL